MFRWISGIIFFGVGLMFWFGSMIADPYTSMGTGPQYLRPSVADIGINLAALAIGSLTGTAAILFSTPRNRRGWLALFLALILTFLIGTAVWRLIWVRFLVLDG